MAGERGIKLRALGLHASREVVALEIQHTIKDEKGVEEVYKTEERSIPWKSFVDAEGVDDAVKLVLARGLEFAKAPARK